jgi:serine/threonine protein kinase
LLPARPSSLIGRQLNGYRILSFLGAGGMCEVFRAHDTILGREVAIKILPSALAGDPERLDRLRREACVLASLNHPNIATIYGLEEYRDTHFLVLELVEGETLATYIANRRGTPRETFHICSQIAEALGEAHKKAIVHRDIKPENIKLTPQGRVKVLDFGLAKAFSAESPAHDRIGRALVETEGGRIVGTPPYMCPERLRGNTIDARSDLWAFGCLAYEMLTGKRAFAGGSPAETFAAILGQEPDWNRIPAETPAEIVGLLQRCLQKDARRRPADAETASRALQRAASSGPAPRRFSWRQASLAITLLLAGILTAVGFAAGDPLAAGTRSRDLKRVRTPRHRRCVFARRQSSHRFRSLS